MGGTSNSGQGVARIVPVTGSGRLSSSISVATANRRLSRSGSRWRVNANRTFR